MRRGSKYPWQPPNDPQIWKIEYLCSSILKFVLVLSKRKICVKNNLFEKVKAYNNLQIKFWSFFSKFWGTKGGKMTNFMHFHSKCQFWQLKLPWSTTYQIIVRILEKRLMNSVNLRTIGLINIKFYPNPGVRIGI